MGVGQAEIAALIPHAGRMCLLESVESWSDVQIVCRTNTHRDPANPLRHDGALAAVHLVEYSAQAMAVHGGLMQRAAGGGGPKPGLLAALRDVRLQVTRIDDIPAPLAVKAHRLLANADGWLYAFEVTGGGRTLASGRVGVIHPDAALL